MQTATLANENSFVQRFSFERVACFLPVLLHLHPPKGRRALREAFPTQTICHKKLFPALHDFLGKSLAQTVVS